jgi:hypothetical protein
MAESVSFNIIFINIEVNHQYRRHFNKFSSRCKKSHFCFSFAGVYSQQMALLMQIREFSDYRGTSDDAVSARTTIHLTGADTCRVRVFRYRESWCDNLALS